MKTTLEVNETNFETEVLNSSRPVLVDFWAEWCGPCKMIAPLLEELAMEQAGRLKIAKINVDENPGLVERYRVQSVPTMLYFANGLIWEQIIGATSKRNILSKLESLPANIKPQLNLS